MSNGKKGREHPKEYPMIDGFFATFFLLVQTSRIEEFLDWITERYGDVNADELLDGYTYLVVSILRILMNEIDHNSGLKLTENRVYRRASFTGVMLYDVPNSCEKTVLLKLVRKYQRNISGSKNWEKLKASLTSFLTEFGTFQELMNESLLAKKGLDTDQTIKTIAAHYIGIFLCDTDRGFPHSELIFPMIRRTITESYLERAFTGYIYGLEFLWRLILGEDEFGKSFLSDLHDVLDEDFDQRRIDEDETASIITQEMLDELIPQEDPNVLEEEDEDSHFEDNSVIDRWKRLDYYYGRIFKEIVVPREKGLTSLIGLEDNLFLRDYKKIKIQHLLDKSRVSKPVYLEKKDRDSIRKKLDLAMLWYPSNVLESDSIFNGVPTFGFTLLGSAEYARIIDDNAVRALIIKHPAERGLYDYSFAVLVNAFGSIYDASGWVVAFDCAEDDSGHLILANQLIQLAKETKKVKLTNLIVEKKLFKKYLTDRSVSSVFKTVKIRSYIGEDRVFNTPDFISKVQGQLFEYVVQKWVNEKRPMDVTQGNVVVSGEEIDCLNEGSNLTEMYECKLSIGVSSLDNTLIQIRRKIKALKKEGKEAVPFLVVYGKLSKNLKSRLNDEGIKVLDYFRNVVSLDQIFKASRDVILQILDTDVIHEF